MDAAAAAFLIELGVGDTIVGTAAPDFRTDFSGTLRKRLDRVPTLDGGRGNKETVIAAKPDLVTGISVYELGSFDGSPSPQVLRQNGIASLVACDTGSGASENVDATYRYITNLAATFHEQARGEELVAALKAKIARAAAKSTRTDVPVLTLSAVPSGGAAVNTSGGSSFANGIIRLAGGRNVAAGQLSDFASLSAEQVAEADPEVIVAVSGFSSGSDASLVDAIRASPLLADTDAVRTGNIVVVPQRILLSPSLLNDEAVATIAEAVQAAS